MTRRYEIQDILAQDTDGVVFRATDRESGRDVVLRRFFPQGRDGGGLKAAEQPAFLESVGKLKSLEHKGLRKVIDGGCDPVDGMPFLVTEWVEGTTLAEFSGDKALETASVKGIVELALETSLEISKVLGEDALWVGCGAEALVVPESGRGITFWVSPFRPKESPGLLPLAELVDRLMHWKGRPQIDSAGDGLGGWIRQIRAKPRGWTLAEAIKALHEPAAIAPTGQIRRAPGAVTAKATVATKATAVKKAKPRKSVVPWVLTGIVLLLGGAGAALWKAGKLDQLVGKLDGPTKEKPMTREEMIKTLAAKSSQPVATGPAVAASPAQAPQAVEPATPVKKPGGPVVVVTGKIRSVGESNSGSTRYLEVEIGDKVRWIGYRTSNGQTGLELADLKALQGKTVRVTGEPQNESPRGQVLFIQSRADIVEQP